LAAMPSAIETTAAAVKPGDFESRRNAYVRSCRQAATVLSPQSCGYVAFAAIVP